MPRITPPQEFDRLLALVALHPDGIGADALLRALGNSLQRRTLQRRLALLVAQGRIQMLGEARSVRYTCPPQADHPQTRPRRGLLPAIFSTAC